MKTLVLKNQDLTATFLPELGMNLASYKKGDLEVIDQNTLAEFEERFSGLGPVIGPHFHRQKEEWITSGYDEDLFPHIARVKKRGIKDPFSHGIARYVPWRYDATETSIVANIEGSDTYKGVPLSRFEGVDFKMTFTADLSEESLGISMSVESKRPSLVGLHYYYALVKKKGTVTSNVQDEYCDQGEFKPIPSKWYKDHQLNFNLKNEADYGFLPYKKDAGGVLLETGKHKIKVRYQGQGGDICWQLFSPKNSTFACIEPISARNPRKLKATSSSFMAQIEIIV